MISKFPFGAENPFILAPMIAGSDLAFRILVSGFGIGATFTPMINVNSYLNGMKSMVDRDVIGTKIDNCEYNKKPLIIQIAGSNQIDMLRILDELPDTFEYVDINLGCPKNIAKKGDYGVFALQKTDRTLNLIKNMVNSSKRKISIKIRILDKITPLQEDGLDKCRANELGYFASIKRLTDTEIMLKYKKTLDFFDKLKDSGIYALTIHARDSANSSHSISSADWDLIKFLKKQKPNFYIIGNGSVNNLENAKYILETTGCDAVMLGESILCDPCMLIPMQFKKSRIDCAILLTDLVNRYHYKTNKLSVKSYIYRLLYAYFNANPEQREKMKQAESINELQDILHQFKSEYIESDFDEYSHWYYRHLKWIC